jgi:multimeric flavodoxin WrbA
VYKANVKPCTGCVACGYEGTCVQRDDMTSIRQNILDSDMIVFVTPLYYYGFSAQLKTVIDRFCAFNASLTGKQMKSVLISAAWNADSWTFEALETHYKTLVRYLHFEDCGSILGYGCCSVGMTQRSEYPQLAYKLGKSI